LAVSGQQNRQFWSSAKAVRIRSVVGSQSPSAVLVFSWVFTVRGNPPKNGSGPATLKFRFIHRIIGGGINHGALAGVGARAMEQAIVLFARDRVLQLPPANKSLKSVPGLTAVHRTPLSGRRLAQR